MPARFEDMHAQRVSSNLPGLALKILHHIGQDGRSPADATPLHLDYAQLVVRAPGLG
jgi:hypothetical protein